MQEKKMTEDDARVLEKQLRHAAGYDAGSTLAADRMEAIRQAEARRIPRPDLVRLMSCGKKQLAREVHRLQGVLEEIKDAGAGAALQAQLHRHAEAFAMMRYVGVDDGSVRMVWNGRDGVTPFSFSEVPGGQRFQHDVRSMVRGVYSPDMDGLGVDYVWETLGHDQAVASWHRYLDRAKARYAAKAEEEGVPLDGAAIERLNAARLREPDESYYIGLRSVRTGRLADEVA